MSSVTSWQTARATSVDDIASFLKNLKCQDSIVMQQHGTLKYTQGMLRHASIKTTGDVYVQTIEENPFLETVLFVLHEHRPSRSLIEASLNPAPRGQAYV